MKVIAFLFFPFVAIFAETKNIGNWEVTLYRSPLDGTAEVFARTLSVEPVSSGDNIYKPQLCLRYQAGDFKAYIILKDYIGTGMLKYQVKHGRDNPIEKKETFVSSDFDSFTSRGYDFFFINNKIKFIDKIIKNKMVAFRLDISEASKHFVFNTTGIEVVKNIINEASSNDRHGKVIY